jgi:putative lipoic acid-binding regulatory protein
MTNMNVLSLLLQFLLVSLRFVRNASAFLLPPQIVAVSLRRHLSDASDGTIENVDDDEQPIIAPSTVRIDDGGSNLTDRFKYKVNALMGVFDPANGVDDERQDGNILNAMLQFPTEFSFSAVGRTNGDDLLVETYAQQVKEIVTALAGEEDNFQCQITPRGKSFTRVSIKVRVDSAAVINSIYHELDKMEMTVMKY